MAAEKSSTPLMKHSPYDGSECCKPCRSGDTFRLMKRERGWPGDLWKRGLNAFLNRGKDHLHAHAITCCLSSVKDFHIHDAI